uniref:Uncharacterized protein n=1 Tax=Rhodnius prolixus TaxID=13249 RepID=T1HEA0_RHOPR
MTGVRLMRFWDSYLIFAGVGVPANNNLKFSKAIGSTFGSSNISKLRRGQS